MLHMDGSVNQDFFKPQGLSVTEERRWGDAERQALLQGLQMHGVGR
jgi:hypothetical protein